MFDRLEDNTKFENRIYTEVTGVLSLTNILRKKRIRFTRECLPFSNEVVEKITFNDILVRFVDNKIDCLCRNGNVLNIDRLGFDWQGNLVYEESVFRTTVGRLME